MAKVVDKKNKKGKNSTVKNRKNSSDNLENNINESQEKSIKIYEKYTCFVVGIIIAILLFATFKNAIFIPALLITIGLELFCIAYYYLDNEEKRSLVYILFITGVALVIIAIIYTIIKTV